MAYILDSTSSAWGSSSCMIYFSCSCMLSLSHCFWYSHFCLGQYQQYLWLQWLNPLLAGWVPCLGIPNAGSSLTNGVVLLVSRVLFVCDTPLFALSKYVKSCQGGCWYIIISHLTMWYHHGLGPLFGPILYILVWVEIKTILNKILCGESTTQHNIQTWTLT